MSLVLEIEFLTGVCRAAREPASDEPDWPPQPDRVFSALVSAWAARGQQPEERTALEWLEEQAPPAVHASGHAARTAPEAFVPPNDLKFSKAEKTYIKVMPDRRPRQPRRFPITRPEDPVMAMVWAQEPEPKQFEALDAVAHDIGYIGHSASLVRCRFMRGGADAQSHPATRARRRIYPGRLAELERAHRTNPIRPVISPGSAVPTDPPSSPPALSPDWLVLETIGGAVPDICATALVCRCRGLAGPVRRAQEAIRDLEAGVVGSDPAPCRSPRLGGRAHLMTANAIYRLDGLESDNLLAFLALLGLLRALEESRPTWYPRAFWTVDAPPIRSSLCIREPVSEKAVVAAAAEGLGSRAKALHLAPFMRLDELKKIEKTRKKEKLSLSCEEDAELRKLSALQDLKLPPEDAAERLEDAAHGDSSGADLWASLIVDAAVRSDGLAERTPLSLLSGQGHQHFLSRLALVPQQATPPPRGVGRGKKEISEADCLREALFMPWTRPDATFSFARGGFRPENS